MSNALIRMLKEVGSLCGLQDDIYCFKGTVLRKMVKVSGAYEHVTETTIQLLRSTVNHHVEEAG